MTVIICNPKTAQKDHKWKYF